MKSNKETYVRYEYRNDGSVGLMTTMRDLITEYQDRQWGMWDAWIDNPDAKKLPKDDFEITYLSLDKDGHPATIQFSERLK